MADNDTVGCDDNRSPFTLGSARLMYGYAALENATLTSDVTDSPSSAPGKSATSIATALPTASTSSSTGGSCQDDSLPIGLGVGVPFGIIALLAVAWGFWERRKRVRAQEVTAAAIAGVGFQGDQQAASRSYYEKSQVPSGGHLQAQPVQEAGAQVAELHSSSSPAEITVI